MFQHFQLIGAHLGGQGLSFQKTSRKSWRNGGLRAVQRYSASLLIPMDRMCKPFSKFLFRLKILPLTPFPAWRAHQLSGIGAPSLSTAQTGRKEHMIISKVGRLSTLAKMRSNQTGKPTFRCILRRRKTLNSERTPKDISYCPAWKITEPPGRGRE